MEKTKITYRYADLGRLLARCDHASNVIELNAREFSRLSPLYQDYVWIHECVHLLMDVYDETRCNSITDEVFLLRATDDLAERRNFIERSNSMISAFQQPFRRPISRSISPMAAVIAIILLFVLLKN